MKLLILKLIYFHFLIVCLILSPLFSLSLNAAAVKIDFEDEVPGSQVKNRYLAKYGVYFNSARICQPVKGTASGSQALSHATSLMEFSSGPLVIYFNGPQSRVRLAAGLNGNPLKPIAVKMEAFDGTGKLLKTVNNKFGPGSTPISNPLEIKINQKKIFEVRLTYDNAYFEVIDDLEFDDPVVPPPDNVPPIVKINKPLNNEIFHQTFFKLDGTIKEEEGLVAVKVAIESPGLPVSEFQLTTLDYDDSSSPIPFNSPAIGILNIGKNAITVTATDIGNNVGSDTVIVDYFPNVSSLRTLGVYSLWQYEKGWKDPVGVAASLDPYEDFWDFMINGSGAHSTNKSLSKRFVNQEVTLDNIIPIPGVNPTSWDDFDMVFFYGHNNTIIPPGKDPNFTCYTKNKNQGTWDENTPCDNWGSPKMPFDYYASGSIGNAYIFPGAVTYLYNEYTASLLGDPYDYGGGEPEGSPQFYKIHWYDTPKKVTYGKLGTKNLKWLILHGCQAVMTAWPGGDYLHLAYKSLSEIYGGYHIILGHYKSYYTNYLKPLEKFGYDLICGVPIQTAYFDTDPDQNSSAIAAEDTPFSWATSTMTTDNWLSPVSKPISTNTFSQRWIVSQGINEKNP